jgi:hypothetical protein
MIILLGKVKVKGAGFKTSRSIYIPFHLTGPLSNLLISFGSGWEDKQNKEKGDYYFHTSSNYQLSFINVSPFPTFAP